MQQLLPLLLLLLVLKQSLQNTIKYIQQQNLTLHSKKRNKLRSFSTLHEAQSPKDSTKTSQTTLLSYESEKLFLG